jgi:hypothetical protein
MEFCPQEEVPSNYEDARASIVITDDNGTIFRHFVLQGARCGVNGG